MATKRRLSEVSTTSNEDDESSSSTSSSSPATKRSNGEEKKEAGVSDEPDLEDDEGLFGDKRRRKGTAVPGSMCPYLDTINRSMLDFDFEKVCSVTLLNLNVYACLVCGKYYQGNA